MGFDRQKAQLDVAQLDLAEAVDQIYEMAGEELGDGFNLGDLFAARGVAGPLLAMVRALRAAESKERLGNLLMGAGAGVWNDNFPFAESGDDG